MYSITLLVIVSQFGKASVFLMAKLLFELNVFHWGMLIFLSPFVVIAIDKIAARNFQYSIFLYSIYLVSLIPDSRQGFILLFICFLVMTYRNIKKLIPTLLLTGFGAYFCSIIRHGLLIWEIAHPYRLLKW